MAATSVKGAAPEALPPWARKRKVTAWPRVQGASGLKVVSVVPLVMPFSRAQATAS